MPRADEVDAGGNLTDHVGQARCRQKRDRVGGRAGEVRLHVQGILGKERHTEGKVRAQIVVASIERGAKLDCRCTGEQHIAHAADVKVEGARAIFAEGRHIDVDRVEIGHRLQVQIAGLQEVGGPQFGVHMPDAGLAGGRQVRRREADDAGVVERCIAGIEAAGEQPRPHLTLEHRAQVVPVGVGVG